VDSELEFATIYFGYRQYPACYFGICDAVDQIIETSVYDLGLEQST